MEDAIEDATIAFCCNDNNHKQFVVTSVTKWLVDEDGNWLDGEQEDKINFPKRKNYWRCAICGCKVEFQV